MRFSLVLMIVLSSVSFSTYATDLFPDSSCYFECPNTPSGKLPLEFFNIPTFRQPENCKALQGFCRWVNMTSPLELKPVIVSDYDGTQASEKVSIQTREAYISSRARSENSVVFGVIAPKLKAMGYDIGMQTIGLSNKAAAEYIAARDDSCETTDVNSNQAKFDYCMSGRLVGMAAKQVRALHRIMYRVFPQLNSYYSTTQAMLNYLVAMGYPLWTQTGGTPYPAIQKSNNNLQLFNSFYRSKNCDYLSQSSEVMNRMCQIIYDAPKIGSGKFGLVMNTENVCDGISYAEAEHAGKTQLCIDNAEGKVSGLHAIEKRSKNVILNFQGNSSGDFYPGTYVAAQGGIVFIHNNPSVCEAINKKFQNSCFNIVDANSETTKTLTSPDDQEYAIAAEQEGLLDSYREVQLANKKIKYESSVSS